MAALTLSGGPCLTASVGVNVVRAPMWTTTEDVDIARRRALACESAQGGFAMTAEEWVLAATVFFSGLASGLLGMLCTIMRPMLTEMSGRDFRTFMEAFLRFADHSLGKLYNLAWSLGMFLLPVVALVLLWDERGSTAFVLTAIGLGIVFAGVVVVSNAVKTPHYKVMLAWDPDAMPADWEAGRDRYFAINWIQMVATWSAFALFIGALTAL
jgi:hypothetical protein